MADPLESQLALLRDSPAKQKLDRLLAQTRPSQDWPQPGIPRPVPSIHSETGSAVSSRRGSLADTRRGSFSDTRRGSHPDARRGSTGAGSDRRGAANPTAGEVRVEAFPTLPPQQGATSSSRPRQGHGRPQASESTALVVAGSSDVPKAAASSARAAAEEAVRQADAVLASSASPARELWFHGRCKCGTYYLNDSDEFCRSCGRARGEVSEPPSAEPPSIIDLPEAPRLVTTVRMPSSAALARGEDSQVRGQLATFGSGQGGSLVERQHIYEMLQTPKVQVVDRIVELPQVQERDVIVEVPEIHHNIVVKEIPRIEVEEVEQPVEIPEVHWEEDIVLIPEWTREEVVKTVPRTTVTEVIRPVVKTIEQVEEEIIEVPMPMPVIERIIERPLVEVKDNVHHVRGKVDVQNTEQIIEVPHVVQLPKFNVVAKPETRKITKQVIVPHVERIEKVVEVEQEDIREKIVEVPQVHVVRNVRYVPKFETEMVWTEEDGRKAPPGMETTRPQDVWQRLQEVHVQNSRLQQEKKDLQSELENRLQEITRLRDELHQERQSKAEMAVKMQSTPQPRSQARRPSSSSAGAAAPAPEPRAPIAIPPSSYQPSSTRQMQSEALPPSSYQPSSTQRQIHSDGLPPSSFQPSSTRHQPSEPASRGSSAVGAAVHQPTSAEGGLPTIAPEAFWDSLVEGSVGPPSSGVTRLGGTYPTVLVGQ